MKYSVMVPILVITTQQSHIQTQEHLWKLTTSLWSGFFSTEAEGKHFDTTQICRRS